MLPMLLVSKPKPLFLLPLLFLLVLPFATEDSASGVDFVSGHPGVAHSVLVHPSPLTAKKLSCLLIRSSASLVTVMIMSQACLGFKSLGSVSDVISAFVVGGPL